MEYLTEALNFYHTLTIQTIGDDMFEFACQKYIKILPKIKEHGQIKNSYEDGIMILEKLVDRFPNKITYKKSLAIEYFWNHLKPMEAVKLFKEIYDEKDTLGTIH